MKLSTRSRYGMRAVLELALEYGKGPLRIKTIASREDISSKYLEQLVAILKSSGLVRSFRGPKGGYTLAKAPSEITLYEIFKVFEGESAVVLGLEDTAVAAGPADLVTRQVWMQVQTAMLEVLESKTLQDLVDEVKKVGDRALNYQI